MFGAPRRLIPGQHYGWSYQGVNKGEHDAVYHAQPEVAARMDHGLRREAFEGAALARPILSLIKGRFDGRIIAGKARSREPPSDCARRGFASWRFSPGSGLPADVPVGVIK